MDRIVTSPFHRQTARRGFTLIELLVVIAIIAALVAILIPALAAARRVANTSKCLANQKALITATWLYAQENADWLPATGYGSPPQPNWLDNPNPTRVYTPQAAAAGQLGAYMRDVRLYRCPQDIGPWLPETVQNISSYVMNGSFCSEGPDDPTDPPIIYRLSGFAASCILYWENPSNAAGIVGDDPTNAPPDGIGLRHNGGTTVGALDGHAEVFTRAQFSAKCQFGPNELWCDPEAGDGGVSQYPVQPIPNPVFGQ